MDHDFVENSDLTDSMQVLTKLLYHHFIKQCLNLIYEYDLLLKDQFVIEKEKFFIQTK